MRGGGNNSFLGECNVNIVFLEDNLLFVSTGFIQDCTFFQSNFSYLELTLKIYTFVREILG